MPPRAKQDQRIEVRFMFKEGLTQKEILTKLRAVHGAQALSKSSVQRWVWRFQNEGDAVGDKPKSGHPKIRDRVRPVIQAALQTDRRRTICQLANHAQVSTGTVHNVLKKDLALKKKPAKWIPHLLTAAQHLRRVTMARAALGMMRTTRRNPGIRTVVVMDESWFHTWDPESKEDSKQWLAEGQE